MEHRPFESLTGRLKTRATRAKHFHERLRDESFHLFTLQLGSLYRTDKEVFFDTIIVHPRIDKNSKILSLARIRQRLDNMVGENWGEVSEWQEHDEFTLSVFVFR